MITVNIELAKQIGHNIRRQQRAEEFEPLDEKIAKQLPGTDFSAVEADRQTVRDKYAEIQNQIDDATTPEHIKSVLGL